MTTNGVRGVMHGRQAGTTVDDWVLRTPPVKARPRGSIHDLMLRPF